MKTIRLLYPDHLSGGLDTYYFGANLLAHILPANENQPLLRVEIAPPDGKERTVKDGIRAREEVTEGIRRAAQVIEAAQPDKIITIGGNCIVSQAPFDYLHGRYGLPTEKVTAEGKGEDWEGLREAVGRSDMKAKDEVLDIIDTYDIFDGREKLLMDLRGGDPYRYMLEHIFPPLRRMEMRIDYRVRAFDPEEAGELIGRRPQDLSLQEMYEVAQAENDDRTIVRQRDAYGREYDIAVRYFPDDDIANINASSAALVRGDLELAWVCLGRVRENPLAANNLGVYHWLCGKIGEAEAYFEKARATDPQRAAYNLEQLRKWKEEFGDEAEAGIDNVSE